MPRQVCKETKVAGMRVIDFDRFRKHLADELKLVGGDDQEEEGGEVTVVTWWERPVGVLVRPDLWAEAQHEKPVESLLVQRFGMREARQRLTEMREVAGRGKHTIVTVNRRDRAVYTPFAWADEVFGRMGLFDLSVAGESQVVEDDGAAVAGPECVLMLFRRAVTVAELLAEYAGSADPVLEMDRRLVVGPGRISAGRRRRLRGVVYVEDGVVARVRAVDPDGEWVNLPDRVSLAPVSAPLSAAEIDEWLPTLRMYPGDEKQPRQGAPREYVDL
ncbi:hypothetical protein [Nocardia wallacei]|uniref:hypothetical protein n=1 Tax=Nocardia wallacei TaxID=480035 RepID=UPI0024583531|nr:hypothetical protein [Nocardia wallacei]